MASLGHAWQVVDQPHQHVHEVRCSIEADDHLQLLQPSNEHVGVAIDEAL